MNFERLLVNYIDVLDSHKHQLYSFLFYPEILRGVLKTLHNNPDSFSYVFTKISLTIPKQYRPSHAIPRTVGDIEIILSIEDDIVIKKQSGSKIEDPLVKLEKFNIILSSDKYTSSWHFDRHEKKNGEVPKSIHPIYHLTFGGHYMENLQQDGSDEFGRTLIVRAPRIMHPPMELILGLDFIFSHFIPKDELDLLSDPVYIKIISEMKKYFWLPFALALAKNYCDTIEINRNSFSFDEEFVKSVLSC